MLEHQRYIEALRAEAKAKDIRHEEEIEKYELIIFNTKAWGSVIIGVLSSVLIWFIFKSIELQQLNETLIGK